MKLFRLLFIASFFSVISSSLPVYGNEVFRSHKLGLSFTSPVNWTISKQTGFAQVIAVILPPSGKGKILVTHDANAIDGVTSKLIAANEFALKKMGATITFSNVLKVGAEKYWEIRAITKSENFHAKQVYLGQKDVFIFTLMAPKEEMAALERALEDTLRSVRLEEVAKKPRL